MLQVWDCAVGALYMWLAISRRPTRTAGAPDRERLQAAWLAPCGAQRLQGPRGSLLGPGPRR
eukprot:1155691-Pelagomonas_calceolata.AAC.1